MEIPEALRKKVFNRGSPHDAFLREMIEWGRTADAEIFAPNDADDIYSHVRKDLGPWRGAGHRRAVMLEVMRVLAGFESSWDWNEGRDINNPSSNKPETTEAGAWQVSADSMNFGSELKQLVRTRAGTTDARAFQAAMKSDHVLAMEYIARLLRRTVRHNGPVKRHEINAWLCRDAVDAFEALLDA